MPTSNTHKSAALRLAGLFMLLVVPGAAVAGMQSQGMQSQGMQSQGMQSQGMQSQGMQSQGMQSQGMQSQGMQSQGMQSQGMQSQGMQSQGMQSQGMQSQGMQSQGVAVIGNDAAIGEFKGVDIHFVEMKGTSATSGVESHVLTNIPNMSAGPGNYIWVVSSGSAVGHYAVAHLRDAAGNPAEDLDLFIAGEQKDPMPNLFHRVEEQDNQDELYVVYFFQKATGQWLSLCPFNPDTGSASAIAIPEKPSVDPHRFIFACTATGVASKCARNWGYRPWATTQAWEYSEMTDSWSLAPRKLEDYYAACVPAAMAAYCQDGQSYTKNGTLVDLFDTRQIIWPNSVENPFNASNQISLWMMAQEYFSSTGPSPVNPALRDTAMQRTRYKDLVPGAECGNFAYIDRLEHDHIEDGRWAGPLTNTPRIQVFSPNYCPHNEYTVDPQPLAWDCSPCTTKVCQGHPECCGAGPAPTGWTAACVAEANLVCQTGGVQWPKGMSWPKDLPPAPPSPILPKFLQGAAGAVLRVDGSSSASSSATISGWACDPEWPGATVGVRIYAGAPRDQGGTPLAEVRADQALAAPLAREVAIACDGPTRSYTRHGFSYTLPANHSGNVYVYAIDQATEDGPAAPPTLVRNGIVPVPRCAHSEFVAGAALDEGCSPCVDTVCGDGTHGSCCSGDWDDQCAIVAADFCAPGTTSAPVNAQAYTAVTTGWIEAPADGSYTFDSSLQPSRLYVNGTLVLDWFQTSPGTRQGSITLARGQRYHLRWDRLAAEPPASPGPGLTWQPPGAVGQEPIPSSQLYLLAPGGGTGLTATYFTTASYGGIALTRKDAFVDINTDVEPPSPSKMDLPAGYGPTYSAIWEGEIVPSFTEAYRFHIVGSGTATLFVDGAPVTYTAPIASSAPGGCAHDLCLPGDKLDASCNSCVQAICAKDPYCCDGGYLSYYSYLPVWDARCIAEVETYCAPSRCAPTPGAGSPEKKTDTVALKAGVHHTIRLEYKNPTGDKTIRLLWSSPHQNKQVIPSFALYPKAATPTGQGAGLNITLFGTTLNSEEALAPDLDSVPVAAGVVADLSLTPTVGPLGTPVVDFLAATDDTSAGKPWPPIMVRPRFEDEVFVNASGRIKVRGVGGIGGAWIHLTVVGGGADMVVPINSDGQWFAEVPIATGLQKLQLVQQTYAGAGCVAPAFCAESDPLFWPLKVTLETASPDAPIIFSPIDPAHDPSPAAGLFAVVGRGTSGTVNVVDHGGLGAIVNPTSFSANPDGTFSTQITLSNGAGDPNKGWHKLLFNQGGPSSIPVFVSVGIQPPTVEFPRTGAELDCKKPDPAPGPVTATGILPYTEKEFGRLQIFEETGRSALRPVATEMQVFPPQQQGEPIRFRAQLFGLSQGDHVLYFVQAPEPPANSTDAERDAYFRGLAAIADTPTSRIVIKQPPPRFDIDAGSSTILRTPQLNLNVGNCVAGQKPPGSQCAEPNADVNLRIGERVYTKRADASGNWSLSVDMPPGWSEVSLAQVTDSFVGGAWTESCRSNTVAVGVFTPGGPDIKVPGNLTLEATGPQGAKGFYDVTAHNSRGEQVPVTCVPPSGSVFPIGTTFVRCQAVDKETGAAGLAGFAVTVIDGPPVVKVPPAILAEAQSALGAIVSFEAKAEDAVDGPLPVECVPASPALFALDETNEVVCRATDTLIQTATDSFKVRVVDTTPPVLCGLPDLVVPSTSPTGAFVSFATCATDLVDGATGVSCDHGSGSFFPIGKTLVSCSSIDRHGNASPQSTFTVTVGDAIPPKLKLPGTITAFATSRNGARVKYEVTATDNVDPDPVVACSPPSGALFPLGATTVKCKATDDAGNVAQGTFTVRVIVKFKGLLPPIADDGSSRFKVGLALPLRFELAGPSANIWDLAAKLFVAPINAAGVVGPERPAAGLSPGAGNLFYFLPIINQYAMLLDTRPMSAGAWQLRVDLGDGEVHTDRITLLRW